MNNLCQLFFFQTQFVGYESEPFEYSFDTSNVILYALGVGASTKTTHGLNLLYEGSENFSTLTSFGVIPAFGGLTGLVSGKVPGLNIDLSKLSTYRVFHLRMCFFKGLKMSENQYVDKKIRQ